MDMSRYLDLFLSEAQDHIQASTRDMQRVAGGDRTRAPLDALFRHFHSIKGMGASMGFRAVASLSHAMEDLLDHLRRDPHRTDAACVETLTEAIDRLGDLIARCGRKDAVPQDPDQELIARIRAPINPQPSRPAAPDAAPSRPTVPAPTASPGEAPPARDDLARYACSFLLAPTDMPGARAALTLRRIEEWGAISEIAPDRSALSTSRFDGHCTFVLETRLREAECRDRFAGMIGIRDFTCEFIGAPPASEASAAPDAPALPASLRVPTSALDRLLDATAELITRRGLLRETLRNAEAPGAIRSLDRLSESIEALRDQVMSLRLLPFAHIVPRLERAMRDLTRVTGHEAHLEVTGGDVALDRSVLEEILDPLMHVLRNAVDHGIGSGPERRRRGKPPVGRIGIDVSRRSDRIVILVEDDGDGMDVEAIRRCALQGGYATQGDLERMTEDQVLMLTTIPGFSTAGRVTEVSGRGVGMDVVRTRIEALQGTMTIRSRAGRGTRIEWNLPPSVAVVDAFLVRCRGNVIAIPAAVVCGVSRAEEERIRSSHAGRFLDVGGQGLEGRLLPLATLHDLLGASADRADGAELLPGGPLSVITYEVHGTRGALAVEEILGRQEMVVKPLGAPLEQMRAYSGAALMDDGRVALVLDMVGATESF